jgi:AcrR family transcriptional regulator
MSDKAGSGTRARILDAARDLFAQRGYQRTSIHQIAERIGVVKTAVLHHFPSKADILSALVEPLLRDWEAAVVAAAHTDGTRARWVVIEGVLDACLAHRHVLRMHLHDLTVLSHEPVYQRFVGMMSQQQRLVAGPDADLAGKIRAAQAIAMLTDPVVLFADAPTETLRREVLCGVRRLYGEQESASTATQAKPARRTRGRPATMSPEAVEAARRMHASGAHTVPEIAARLGVSRATVYRHLRSTAPDS